VELYLMLVAEKKGPWHLGSVKNHIEDRGGGRRQTERDIARAYDPHADVVPALQEAALNF
jgi:hypothetical protein